GRVGLDAGLADHDPRAGRVDVDRDPLRVLADQDVRQARVRELLVDVLPDADVLLEEVREVLASRVPVRLPVVDDANAHPAGMDLLTHYRPPFVRIVLASREKPLWQGRRERS